MKRVTLLFTEPTKRQKSSTYPKVGFGYIVESKDADEASSPKETTEVRSRWSKQNLKEGAYNEKPKATAAAETTRSAPST